jgi:type I restriction enzyme R subunit
MLTALQKAGFSPDLLCRLEGRRDTDAFDILAELGWNLAAKTRAERAAAFANDKWTADFDKNAAAVIRAIAAQFALGGSGELENRKLFNTPKIAKAGGIAALRKIGDAGKILREIKNRLFAA